MNGTDRITYSELYKNRDESYFEEIQKIKEKWNVGDDEVLKNYMAFVRRREFVQTLAYYELFKRIKDLPGSILEMGVYLGNGLFTWAKLLETFCPGVRGRKVFGFDSFEGYELEKSSGPQETKSIEIIKGIHGHAFKSSLGLVEELVKLNESDQLLIGVERVRLYVGDVAETIDKFIGEAQGVRISLLMLDLNMYVPTQLALKKLYDLVVPGGVIAFRGYGFSPWEGESSAVDEFVKEKQLKLHSFDFSPFPGAYSVKEFK